MSYTEGGTATTDFQDQTPYPSNSFYQSCQKGEEKEEDVDYFDVVIIFTYSFTKTIVYFQFASRLSSYGYQVPTINIPNEDVILYHICI